MDTNKFIILPESYNQHIVGNKKCREGWCSGVDGRFPKLCKCGGLIHAEFGDEDFDGDYWLYHKCDKCGSTDSPDE